MSEPADILQAIERLLVPQLHAPLAGKRALVTSGPTYEPIDPVRFIGNRSSGKQGHAIAAALAAQGADVTLVTGPTALPDPADMKVIHIQTAQEMLAACKRLKKIDIAVCAAAVADWRPLAPAKSKLKKDGGKAAPALALAETPDILADLSQTGAERPKLVIGFAAETDDLMKNASAKFARKRCDWLVANNVADGKIFGADENEVTLLRRGAGKTVKTERWPHLTKTAVAEKLVAEMAKVFGKKM